jgi:hypothetical protein
MKRVIKDIELPIKARRIKKVDGTHEYPHINIPGTYLKELGFLPGDKVQIRYQLNAVSITNVRPVTERAYFKMVSYIYRSPNEMPIDPNFILPKMPGKTPIITQFTKAYKEKGTNDWCPFPKVFLNDAILAESGFVPGKKVRVKQAMNQVMVTNIESTQPFEYVDSPIPESENNRKIITVNTSLTQKDTGCYRFPMIRFGGRWLAGFGFKSGQKLQIKYQRNKIFITEQKQTKTTGGIATKQKYYVVREHYPHRPFQDPYPAILIKGKWLALAGFTPGQKIQLSFTKNSITITREKPGKRSGYIQMPLDAGGVDRSIYRDDEPFRYLLYRKFHKRQKHSSRLSNAKGKI